MDPGLYATRNDGSNREHSQTLPADEKSYKKNKPLNVQKKNTSNAGQRKWSCNKCPESFSTARQLQQHRRDAHRRIIKINQFKFFYDQAKDIYFCDNCPTKCRSQSEMEEHIKTHDPYVCLVCDDIFYSLYKFCVHNQKHEPGCFRCPLCEYQSKNRYLTKRHINTNHLKKFRYTCGVCGKGFEGVSNYKDHKEQHAGAKAISCIVCHKEFEFRGYLLTHQKRFHTVHIDVVTENQCKVCKKTLSSASNLEKHMLYHEKKHLCDICGREFASSDRLRLHYLKHTGIKEYKCSYCTKAFVKRQYLVDHERIHSGEKPFTCEYCEKAFNQRTSLKTHVRGHTGERPYICHICKNGFISKASLNLHLNTCAG